jgi:hypothetical protein
VLRKKLLLYCYFVFDIITKYIHLILVNNLGNYRACRLRGKFNEHEGNFMVVKVTNGEGIAIINEC